MEKFFTYIIRYRFLVISFFVLLSLLGLKAYQNIPVDAFPDITPKQVVIYTESPGNSAEDIEKLITYPIESAMSGLAGVKKILSNSMFGLSYVAIFFEDSYDIYFLRQLINERLQTIDIPKGWGKPTIGPNVTGLGQVLWYYLEDKTNSYSLGQLRALHRYQVAPMLKSISGVEEVITWGGYDKQYEVVIDPNKLQALNITFTQVLLSLQKANQVAGGQYLEFNKEQYLIRANGFYKDIEDIKNTVIKSDGIRSVSISDIATVKVGKAPRFGAVSVDGKERVFGMVLQRTGTNASKVVELIKQKLPNINKTLPDGISLKINYDRSQITKKAVSTMTKALISGSILVMIVLFLFLFEFRTSFIVILSLPISLLIAFLMMQHFDISANLMSLSGLAIAVGMIVDATIVVVENSYRLLSHNKESSKEKAIAKATRSVSKPVVFAILIITAIFIPLLSLDGLAGKLYSPMAINILFVMIASLFVALLLVPTLSYIILKNPKSQTSPLMQKIYELYEPMLDFSLKHTKAILSITSVLFFLLVVMLSLIGREFMPKLNEESIMYRVISIPGTALSQSVQNAQDIERFIKQKFSKEITSTLSMIGRSEKGETAQANYMEVLLTIDESVTDINSLNQRITKELKQRFNYLQFVPTQPIAMRIEELLEGISSELGIKIYGEDQKELAKIASSITSKISSIDSSSHIEIETQLGQAQIVIKPDFLALSRYGFFVEDVMEVIRYGVGEEAVSQKIEGVKRFGIVAKLKDVKDDINSLKNLTLRSSSGKIAKLKELCDIEIKESPAFIKRENLSRYMVVSMEVEKDVASFVQEAMKRLKELKLPTGYYYEWVGDFKNMQQSTQSLKAIIPFTIVVIFLLLYTAFNSLKKALIILVGIPFGLIGGMASLLISGIYLSISAIVGFIIIFAIAVLNGVVLISFIDELEKTKNKEHFELVKEATMLRVRPVLMTAMTTLFGILPLLFSVGVGSQIQYPLAVVVTGGFISSTVLTLLVLPGIYLRFYDKYR